MKLKDFTMDLEELRNLIAKVDDVEMAVNSIYHNSVLKEDDDSSSLIELLDKLSALLQIREVEIENSMLEKWNKGV